MKIRLSSIVTFGILLISAVQGSFYLLWGTRFLYHSHKFEVDANATRKAPEYETRYGFRGQKYIDSIGQDVVEKNKKLFDVEDSTRKYPSPLSYW